MRKMAIGVAELTDREHQTLELMVGGLSNREIAESLGVSINTVKTYGRTVYRKIGARSRVQAVLYWQQNYSKTVGLGDGLAQARREAENTLRVLVPLPGRAVDVQKYPPPLSVAALGGIREQLRRDLATRGSVVREVPSRNTAQLTALNACARAIAQAEGRPVSVHTVYTPGGRAIVRLTLRP